MTARPRPDTQPRLAVFLEGYLPFHERKEGPLVRGLREAGADTILVTRRKPELAGHRPPYPVRMASAPELRDAGFWASLPVDAVLAYTFLNHRFTPFLRAIRDGGKTVLVRADSDGRIGPPVFSRRLLVDPPWTPAGATNLARRIAWRLFPGRMTARRLEHLRAADAVWIETPDARSNLGAFLARAGEPALLDRVECFPVVVSERCRNAPLRGKERQVAAIGRWEDRRPKNPRTLVRVLLRFLEAQTDYRAVVLGSGHQHLRRLVRETGGAGRDRLIVRGPVGHEEVEACLSRSQILFMPSLWEGFPLAAGEAVCLGCTISGTPLESLRFLARDGRGGTLAPDFEEDSLHAALTAEADRWRSGEIDPAGIARYWRPRLAPGAVAAGVLSLLENARR